MQEATSVRTVDHAVIVGEGQVAHGADSDNVVTVNILNNHGALHDGTGTEDCNVRLVDDRGVEQCTERTNVGNGEGRTRQLLGGDVAGTCTAAQVANSLCQASNAQVRSVLDDGNQQTLGGVHSNRDVLGAVVSDLLVVFGHGGVQSGVLLQSLSGCLDEEGQEGQLSALTSSEAVLSLCTQLNDAGHVNLGDLGQLGGDVQGLTHTLCNNLADTCGLLDGATLGGNLEGVRCLCGTSSRSSSCSGCSSGGSSGTLSSDSSLNILLADAATNTGALDGGQVDAVVLSELTDQRGHVCFALSSCRSGRCSGSCRSCGSSRSLSNRSGSCGSLSNRSRSSGSSCSSSVADDSQNLANLCVLILGDADLEQGTCYGGGNLGVNLVGGNLNQGLVNLNLLANFLQPAGNGALGDGLAQCGQYDLNACSSSCGSSRSSGGCCGSSRSLSNRSGSCGSLNSCGSSRSSSTGTVANDSQSSADLDVLVLGDENLLNNACYGGGNLGVNLVGGNLNQGCVNLNGVADLNEPAGNGTLGHGLAQCGQYYGVGHNLSRSPCECLN